MTQTSTSYSEDETPDIAYVIMIAAAAALGGFLFGFDTAVISGAVVAVKNEFGASGLEIGLAVSLALIGSAIGAFIAGPLADRIGRIPLCQDHDHRRCVIYDQRRGQRTAHWSV